MATQIRPKTVKWEENGLTDRCMRDRTTCCSAEFHRPSLVSHSDNGDDDEDFDLSSKSRHDVRGRRQDGLRQVGDHGVRRLGALLAPAGRPGRGPAERGTSWRLNYIFTGNAAFNETLLVFLLLYQPCPCSKCPDPAIRTKDYLQELLVSCVVTPFLFSLTRPGKIHAFYFRKKRGTT